MMRNPYFLSYPTSNSLHLSTRKRYGKEGKGGSRTKKSSRHPPLLLPHPFVFDLRRGGGGGEWEVGVGLHSGESSGSGLVCVTTYTSWQSRSISLLIFFPLTFLNFRSKSYILKGFSKKYVIYGSKYFTREIWEICCFVRPVKEAPGMAGKSRTGRSTILLTMAERRRGAFPVTPRTKPTNNRKCCYVGRPPYPPFITLTPLLFFLDDAARMAQYSLLGQ